MVALLRTIASIATVLSLWFVPCDASAFRGIDPPQAETSPITCAEALRLEIAEGHLKRADEIELRLTNGESVEGRYVGVNHDTLLLVGMEGNIERAPSPYALRVVTGVARSRALFRSSWMAWGMVVGPEG